MLLLFSRPEGPLFEPAQRFDQKTRANRRELGLQRASSFIGSQSNCLLKVNRAGVHFLNQLHSCHAAFPFAVDNGPCRRRRATIFRQQRIMNVEPTLRRSFEDCLRQDPSVGYDNDDFGPPATQSFSKLWRSNFFRRERRYSASFG